MTSSLNTKLYLNIKAVSLSTFGHAGGFSAEISFLAKRLDNTKGR